MQAQRAAITEGRAVTLRSARLPRPMEVEEEELALDQQRQVRGVVVEVSGQRGRQQAPGEPTVVVVVAVALLLVSVP